MIRNDVTVDEAENVTTHDSSISHVHFMDGRNYTRKYPAFGGGNLIEPIE
jgi:hypothetical protein